MAFMYPLSKLYDSFKNSEITKQDFEGKIFEHILENKECFGITCTERGDTIDFLCWLFPRIQRAVLRYEDIGSSFDAYIGILTRMAFKEYKMLETNKSIMECACWETAYRNASNGVSMYTEYKNTNTNDTDDYIGDSYSTSDDDYHASFSDFVAEDSIGNYYEDTHSFDTAEPPPPAKPLVPNPKQLLILLLKSYYHTDNQIVTRAAASLGYDKNDVDAMIEKLRLMRFKQETTIRKYEERMAYLRFRALACERRLGELLPGSPRYVSAAAELENVRWTLKRMDEKKRKLPFVPSNAQIAKVLNLAKGTIDSSWYCFLRKHAQDLIKKRSKKSH